MRKNFKQLCFLLSMIILSSPKQLIYRLYYTIKRFLFSKIFSGSMKRRLNKKLKYTIIKFDPVKAPYLNSNLKIQNGNYFFNFLNHEKVFKKTIDWHPKDKKHGTRLWLLNLHYMEYLQSIESESIKKIILSWVSDNPPFEKEYWKDSWNSYALSIRVVTWMKVLANLSTNAKNKELKLINNSLYAQLRFLSKNLEFDIEGNHIVKNAKALLWGSNYFESKESSKWQLKGENLVNYILESQILNDGMHYELSPSYHCQVFIDLIECSQFIKNETLKKSLDKKLKKMAKCLFNLIHPDGKISLFNDGGYDMALDPHECLNFYKANSNSVDFKKEKIFKNGGYVGYNTNDIYCLMDFADFAAKNLPAHGHSDALSFELSVGNERFFIDPGVFEYNDTKLREISRATESHNTLTINNQNQSEIWGSFRAGRRADVIEKKFHSENGKHYFHGAHNGYKKIWGGQIHSRTFIFSKNKLRILDNVRGDKAKSIRAIFILSPFIKVEIHDDCLLLKGENKTLKFKSETVFLIKETNCFLNFGEIYKTKKIEVIFKQNQLNNECIIEVK